VRVRKKVIGSGNLAARFDTRETLKRRASNMILLPLREKVSAKPTDEGSMGLSASIQRFDFIEV